MTLNVLSYSCNGKGACIRTACENELCILPGIRLTKNV